VQRSHNRPGSHYDRFRGRIAFPVRDHRGRVVGFGARGMGPDAKPKYLNSPEGEMYRKSETLYGIDRARGPIAQGARAVVVEGYTDVLALHQAGVEEAVAVMGTAITPEQLKLLGGYAEEVVLALDADRAGREAMLRAQRVAGSGRLRLLVAPMPEGEDPADMMLTEEGGGRLRRALAEAVELPVFHVRAILGDADLSTPMGRDRALDEVVPVLEAMGDTISRQEMVREVADRLDAAPELVAGRLRGGGARRQSPSAAPEQASPRPRRRTPEEQRQATMLALCMADPAAGGAFIARLTPDHFTSPILAEALEWLREHLDDPLDGLDDERAGLYRALTWMKSHAGERPQESDLEFLWRQLERERLRRELKDAEERGDVERSVELQRAVGRLSDAIASGTR
jgi:DNA primase